MTTLNATQILKDLVNIKTVADNELAVAQYLKKLFNQHGIDRVKVLEQRPGRANLVAEIGDGKGPKLGLEGHEDTVHEGDLKTWRTDPFHATEKGGKLYGRGSTDMKSGLAALAIALIQIHEQTPNLRGTVRFLATISEELDQGGANYLAQKGYVDDLDNVIIGEPTVNHEGQFRLITAHTGNLIYTVESFGKAAHSSTPELGIDAIEKLIRYREQEKALFASYDQQDAELGHTIYTPDVFRGGAQVNSIPDYAYQKVMVRTIPEVDNDHIIKDLRNLIDHINAQDKTSHLKLTVTFSGYPVRTQPTDLAKLIQSVSQQTLKFSILTGVSALGTDASQYTVRNPDLKVVVLGPGNDTAHQANEYVSLSKYQQAIQLYRGAIQSFVVKGE